MSLVVVASYQPKDLQERMFKALGFSAEEANDQFGFLLEAMDYGFPPHGGLAIGLTDLSCTLAGGKKISVKLLPS